MTERSDDEIATEERLDSWRAPGEAQSEERSWELAAAAYAQRTVRSRTSRWVRLGVAGAITASVALLALSPAGAKVGELVSGAVNKDEPPPIVALGGFPDTGPLLVQARDGIWIVEPDGSTRKLGGYLDGAWSPHGKYVAVTDGESLSAVDPEGEVRWTVASSTGASNPAWSPSGFRIAYLSTTGVRVVAGDGSGDGEIAGTETDVGPVWRPPSPARLRSSIDGVGTHELTYLADGRLHLVDTDSLTELWSTRVGRAARFDSDVRHLSWSANGERLLVGYRDGYEVLDRSGRPVVSVPFRSLGAVALSPDGKRVAVVARQGSASAVMLQAARPGGQPTKRLLSTPASITGLSWSPNGRWVVVEWPGADSWVFIRPGGKAVGVGDVGAQFESGRGSFPMIDDWCCRARS